MVEPGRRPSELPGDLMREPKKDHAKPPKHAVLVDNLLKRKLTGKESKPTHAQRTAGRVLFALTLADMIEAKAEQHHDAEPHILPDELSTEIPQTRKALTILYLIQTANLIPMEEFREKWEEETSKYESLLAEVRNGTDGTDGIDGKEKAIMEKAALITPEERKQIAKMALRKMHRSLSRKTISAIREPDPAKREEERGKQRKSVKLTLPTAIIAHAFVIAGTAGATYAAERLNIDLGSFINWLLVVGGSYGVNYGLSLRFNSNAQSRMLENPDIGFSPSFATKAAHDLVDDLLPENTKLKRRAVMTAAALPYIWQDVLLIASIAFPFPIPGVNELAAAALAGRNVGAAGFNYLEGGVVYAYDRRVKNKQNRRRQEKVKRPPQSPIQETKKNRNRWLF